MAVVFTADGTELREASGESFSTVVRSGRLTIKQAGSNLTIDVDGNDVAWVPSASGGPYKRVDTRSFMVSTTDLMSFYYVTLPKGLPEETYEHLNAILAAAKEGKPLPKALAAAAAPVPSAPPVPEAAAAASDLPVGQQQKQEGNPFGDLMGAIARKAMHDTQMLGSMIQQKAQHDINALQEGQKGKSAPAPAPAP